MPIFESLILFAAPVAGALVAYLLRHRFLKEYKLVLSFTGAFLFSIVLLHFMPALFAQNFSSGGFILAGYLIQLVLEQFTRGTEHGHFHIHGEEKKFVYSILFGLSMHALLDGIPLSEPELLHESHHELFAGIALHKIPEGFAFMSVLLISGIRMWQSMLFVFIFSLVAPVAAMFPSVISLSPHYWLIALALAAGSLLHVSTTILFESEDMRHSFAWKKLASILAGGLLAFLL